LCVAAPIYRMNKAWFSRIVPVSMEAAHEIARGFDARAGGQGGALAS